VLTTEKENLENNPEEYNTLKSRHKISIFDANAVIGLMVKIMPEWSLPDELEFVSSKGRLLRLRRYFRWRLSAQVAVTQLPTTADASLHQVYTLS
jgi:hypothetical protein